MGKLSLEERAFETFPDEIFCKDFQKELSGIYGSLVETIATVKNPTKRFGSLGWHAVYQLAFSYKDNYSLAFIDPSMRFNGIIEVIPDSEPLFEHDEKLILRESNMIFLPTSNVQPISFKQFNRRIKFFGIRRFDLILKHLECNPIVLNEAAKRFPENGIMAIEINRMLKPACLVKPSGSQFPKLLKFFEKIKRILKDIKNLESTNMDLD